MKKLLFILMILTISIMAKPRVLMVVTSHDKMGETTEKTGIWLSELTHAYLEFEKSNFDIDIATIKNQPLPIDPRSIKNADKESLEFLANGKKRDILSKTIALKDVKVKNYDAIYLVGGHGVMWDFAEDKNLAKILLKMAKNKKVISAVCHGPAGLLSAKYKNGKSIISGIKVTGFSNSEETAVKLTKVVPYLLEDELKKRKAIFSKAKKDFMAHVVVDKNFVTGQNPPSAKGVALEVIKLLKK